MYFYQSDSTLDKYTLSLCLSMFSYFMISSVLLCDSPLCLSARLCFHLAGANSFPVSQLSSLTATCTYKGPPGLSDALPSLNYAAWVTPQTVNRL